MIFAKISFELILFISFNCDENVSLVEKRKLLCFVYWDQGHIGVAIIGRVNDNLHLKTSLIFIFHITLGLLFIRIEEAKASKSSCVRFRVHLKADLPDIDNNKNDKQTPLPSDLEISVNLWKDKIEFLKNDEDRENWLQCIRHYIFIDTDKNGIPDWTALVDGRPSKVLFPLDPDIDGDGIPNILDPNPYGDKDETSKEIIPSHLSISGEKGRWQKKLWSEEGVLAVNHTNKHIPDTLATLYSILQLRSLRNWKKEVRGFNVLYAFNNRNLKTVSAAYHPSASAISIPGEFSFKNKRFLKRQKCQFVSSILHEMGHALLLGAVTANELGEKARQLSEWELPNSVNDNIFNPVFFSPIMKPRKNFVSNYSKTNVHEWFAESFAAYIWERESLDALYCRAFEGKRVSKDFNKWLTVLLMRAGNSAVLVKNE